MDNQSKLYREYELPIGVSDFKTLIEYSNPLTQQGYLYIDKSLLIKEIIGDGTQVMILTRPRRFGKTLNLSMLKYFFVNDGNQKNTKSLFDELAINKEPKCMAEQGKYPVVFISFKDIKQPDFKLCLEKFKLVIAETYGLYKKELTSKEIDKYEYNNIEKILTTDADQIIIESSLKKLLQFLYRYYKQKPILLIDEYDTPIQESYLKGYYEELMSFFRNFLSEAIKDSAVLNKAVLTGILRVSKESLFSGLSNVEVYSILNTKYASYFGFTEQEVNYLLDKSHLSTQMDQVQAWYNGYNFGNINIYNPLSIIKFIKEKGKLKSYWVNTSGNTLVKNLIINSSYNVQSKIEQLIMGESIQEYIDEHVVFNELSDNSASIWSLLLMSGYLKHLSSEACGHRYLCELVLPNNEVTNFYIYVIEEWFSGNRGFNWYTEFLANLVNGQVAEFALKLQILIEEVISFYDVTRKFQESFYHGLMLAFVSGLKNSHIIKSNKESGLGRYDVALIPKDINNLGIVMEFKVTDNTEQLDQTAKEALNQINQSKYVTELKSIGINNICAMGIGFSNKAVKVVSV